MTTVDTSANKEVERGMTHFDNGRYDEAKAAFEHALTLDPNCAPAWNGIGRVNYHIGTPEAAIAAYEHAIAIDPHFDHAYYGIGILLSAKLGQYEGAVAAFQRGLAANPDASYLQGAIHSTYARMGRLDAAMAAFERSLALNPSDTFALGWLNMILLRRKQFDDVIALCQREIAIKPEHSPHRLLGFALELTGRRDEAILQLEQAIALEPKDYEARAALARLYRSAGRLAEADEHERIAREDSTADEDYGLACVESVMRNADAALPLLKIALDQQQVQLGWVRIDPEFVFIDDDPRFRALVAEMFDRHSREGGNPVTRQAGFPLSRE
jgi:tetratricopeptide (TPR) repeat protein